jgi:hypothetical protein
MHDTLSLTIAKTKHNSLCLLRIHLENKMIGVEIMATTHALVSIV